MKYSINSRWFLFEGNKSFMIVKRHSSFIDFANALVVHFSLFRLFTHTHTGNSRSRARQGDRVALKLSPSVSLKPRSCTYYEGTLQPSNCEQNHNKQHKVFWDLLRVLAKITSMVNYGGSGVRVNIVYGLIIDIILNLFVWV